MRLKAQEDPVEIIKILIMMDVSITAVEIVVIMIMVIMITMMTACMEDADEADLKNNEEEHVEEGAKTGKEELDEDSVIKGSPFLKCIVSI